MTNTKNLPAYWECNLYGFQKIKLFSFLIGINNKKVEKFYREEMIFDDWEKKLALFHNEFIDYFDKIVEVVAPKKSNQIKLDKKFF